MELIKTFQVIILGIIQGVTEFIPISSSGHLVITKDILHWASWDRTFDVALHFGTLLALVFYFKKELLIYIKAFFKSLVERNLSTDFNKKLVWILLLSTLPVFISGGFFGDYIDQHLIGLYVVIFNLIFFAIVLFLADNLSKFQRTLEQSTWADGILIGLAQAISLVPGVSRSGITMTAGILRKYKREDAAKFSFLMLIPAVTGAVIYKALKVFIQGDFSLTLGGYYLMGMLVSFVVGFLCIKFLLSYLQKRSFNLFVIYRVILGTGLILWCFGIR